MERWHDILFGLSLLGWTIFGGVQVTAQGEHHSTPIILSFLGLNFLVSLLMITRYAQLSVTRFSEVLMCLPSLLLGWIVFQGAPDYERWPLIFRVLFFIGCGGAFASFVSLGRSFAIFPALRKIVTRGPYALIRHPLYASELLMAAAVGGAGGAQGDVTLLIIVIMTLMAIKVRIKVEEQHLSHHPNYQTYLHKVRWRILPGVW